MSLTDITAELNEPQAEAVAHARGPLLVFAGAGSGKTRVITYRIANLVACHRVAPYRILAVTFTNKAAGEMRSRLEGMLGPDIARDLWVGTFHATCAKILRRYADAVGLSQNFVIYDAADQKAVVTRVLRDLDLDEKRYPPRMALARIHKEKQEGRGPDEMDRDGYLDETLVKIYARYEAALRASNAVDFEDLILRVVRLLEDEKSLPSQTLRRRFEHLLVDEFQDTNATQYRLIRALTNEHRNLCVVGDDDQSIYSWRGADVRNIRGFKRDFPDATVVKLEQNYRSTSRIVKAALAVIAPSRDREPKDLWTANAEGHPIDVVAAKDERDEAAHVLRVIREARGRGVDLREIAVFYRIHAQSRVLEEALRAENLPYQIVGGTKFYERAEIKDALAYLRVLVNPKSDVDLLRVINVPARGIGATTLDRLTTFATLAGISVFEALGRADEMAELGSGPRARLASVRALLVGLQDEAKNAPPAAVLHNVLEKSGYRAILRKEDSAEADARLENLAELAGSIADYEAEVAARGEAATLDGFLERVSLQSDLDTIEDEGRVTLMTVHGAKGLEFEVVVLTGMEEEMFPYRGMDGGDDRELEEERRLAYVAVTRARDRLVLTHTEMRQIFGTTRWGRPSRFIADLPADAIEHKATRAVASAPGGPQRFVDRERERERERDSGDAWSGGYTGAWRHPQAGAAMGRAPLGGTRTDGDGGFEAARRAAEGSRSPGERFVDTEFFGDDASATDEAPLRRGSRVVHSRFGEGEVRRVEGAGEPAVVAYFPGWGEKKILARFLKLA